METKVIAEVEYARVEQFVGVEGSGLDYMENAITFDDGSKGIRLGITHVYGKNIKEMADSLVAGMKQMKETHHWWSLQTTSLNELKAAYRAGFRNQKLSSLEEHIKVFCEHCETLHVEKVEELAC